MPKITITAGNTGTIPAVKKKAGADQRRALVFELISGTAYWGFTTPVTASGDADAGIPLRIGAPVTMTSEQLTFADSIPIFASADAVVHYIEKLR